MNLGCSIIQEGIGLSTSKVQPLLNKHKNMNSVCMEASMSERNGVMTIRENSLNSDSRAYTVDMLKM